jgi:hypothetical protein
MRPPRYKLNFGQVKLTPHYILVIFLSFLTLNSH